MKLIIKIDLDHDAFKPDNGPELARILRQLADAADGQHISGGNMVLVDHTGLAVGEAYIQ